MSIKEIKESDIFCMIGDTVKDECEIGIYGRLWSFAPYTAGGHGILDIQRNSSCNPCQSPTPPSSSLSPPPRIPARPVSGGNRVAVTRNRIIQARIIHLKNESA